MVFPILIMQVVWVAKGMLFIASTLTGEHHYTVPTFLLLSD